MNLKKRFYGEMAQLFNLFNVYLNNMKSSKRLDGILHRTYL